MGSANSIKQISLHSDRGGEYLIMHDTAHWTFKWGTILKGIEVIVMKEFGNALSAHLVRNNMSNDSSRHFDIAKDDGYIDIFVGSDVLEIRDVKMNVKGICRSSLEKVIFAAVRTYSKQCKGTVREGCVNISSKNSIAAYYCYVNAFKKNGFSTKIQAPESDKQENFVVDFVKDIYMVLNLGQFN